jgi:predicted RNase H-like HicB family nuclease
MITEYIYKSMELAHYEIIEDDGTYWGEISGYQGVWGRADNLEKCRKQLKESLEEWIVFRLKHDLELPLIEGVNINNVEQEVYEET